MPDIATINASNAHEYNFFQLLRRVEGEAVGRNSKAMCAIGHDEPLTNEFVEIESVMALAFQPAPITGVEPIGEPGFERTKIHVACFGLLGAEGVLPAFYSEMLSQRVRSKDKALKSLLDNFNARTISFLYRAWQKSRLPISFERRQCLGRNNENDVANSALGSYVGCKSLTASQIQNSEIKSLLFYFSGYYSKRPRSAYALKKIVSMVLGVEVNILQFFGRWFPLSNDQHNAIGFENSDLGSNFVIGSAVFEGNCSFRIQTEPVGFEKFQSLLPNQVVFLRMQELVRIFAGHEYVIDFQIVLKREQVPPLTLPAPEMASPSQRMGTGLWLVTNAPENDANDAVFALNG